MKKIAIYIVSVKDSKIPFRITPSKSTVRTIQNTFNNKDFVVQTKRLTDGMIVNLLIDNPWSFDKNEFVGIV